MFWQKSTQQALTVDKKKKKKSPTNFQSTTFIHHLRQRVFLILTVGSNYRGETRSTHANELLLNVSIVCTR